MTAAGLGLPDALERAAGALPAQADAIRPANGDPARLLELLGDEGGARVLEWLLRHELEAGAELAEAWSEDREAGAAPLLRLRGDDLPKSARKVLRRVHHRLRSRGVELPDVAPGEVVAKLPPLEDAIDEALVSPIDPRGTRAVYLVEANPSGGARLFELMLDEERGVLELEIFATGRSRVRRFLREFRGRERFRAVPAPPQAVRALVRRTAEAQPAGRPLPRGFAEWRAHVAGAPDDAREPGALAREALAGDVDADALARAEALLRKHELGPWPPASASLESVAAKITEIVSSPIVVSGVRRRQRADEVVGDALADVFTERFAAITAARFEESAYVYWKDEREDAARACLAASAALRERAPADNPVARALLETWLGPLLAKLEPETADEEGDSLLVKPAAR